MCCEKLILKRRQRVHHNTCAGELESVRAGKAALQKQQTRRHLGIWKGWGSHQPCAQRQGQDGSKRVSGSKGHTWVLGEARKERAQSNPATTSLPGKRQCFPYLPGSPSAPHVKPANGSTIQAGAWGLAAAPAPLCLEAEVFLGEGAAHLLQRKNKFTDKCHLSMKGGWRQFRQQDGEVWQV